MKIFAKKKLNCSLFFVLLLIILVLSLVPILILAQYSAPYADDFSFSCETHAALCSGAGPLSLIAAAAEKVADVYMTWQGTFSGIFLMAFQPGIFGMSAYRLTTWIMLLSLSSGIYLFFHTIFSSVLGYSRSVSGIISTAVFLLCIQLMPSANQGLYWYNGAVYYTFTYGFTLITYAIAAHFIQSGGAGRLILLSFLSVLIGGSNYVTALLTVIIFFLLCFFLLLKKNRRWKALLIPFLLVLFSLSISAAAPGNAVRQAEYPDSPNAIMAVLLSFPTAFRYLLSWIRLPYLGMLLFLLPFIWCSSDSSSFSICHAALFTVLSFCVYSAMFTPHLYAEGTPGPDRLINILYYSFLILSVLNLAVWCSALKALPAFKYSSLLSSAAPSVASVFFGSMLFLLFFGIGILFGKIHPTAVMALGELRNGEAKTYYSEMLSRQAVLEDESVSDCIFSPVSVQPYLLFFGDMSSDPTDYTNEDACSFYGKNSIIIQP